jgi:hypothetical protein
MNKNNNILVENVHQYVENLNNVAQEIGHIVIEFNKLEHEIGNIISMFIYNKTINIPQIFTAALGFSQKLDLLYSLYFEYFENDETKVSRLKLFIKNMEKAEKNRNEIVHSWFGNYFFDTPDVSRNKPTIKGRKGLRNNCENVVLQELKRIKVFINSLRHLPCLEISEDIYNKFHSSPNTSD